MTRTAAMLLALGLCACGAGSGTYVPREDPLGTPTTGMLGPRNPVDPLIRNRAHFDEAVAARAHPLNLLSDATVRRLRMSLVIDDDRVVDLDHRAIRAELIEDDYLELMRAFGFGYHPKDPRFEGIPAPRGDER